MIELDRLVFKLLGGDKFERILLRCQGYETGRALKWKAQTEFSWKQAIKFLKAIEVFDARRIREIISMIIQSNQEIFNRPNLFLAPFGSAGKSGGNILYEVRHSQAFSARRYIEDYSFSDLPENSTIIFCDDIIGTGTQSSGYILEKLNLFLSSSQEPFLLSVCATQGGKDHVEGNTNFRVLAGMILSEEEYLHYSPLNKYFSDKEKEMLHRMNDRLKKPGADDFDQGLLVAFFYASPNNSMPILWKDNYRYKDKNNKDCEWKALLPRQFGDQHR